MKKFLTWMLVLSLCLALVAAPALADGMYTPGTYTGVATGHEEGLAVTVTVDESYSYEAEIRAITKQKDDGSAPLMGY